MSAAGIVLLPVLALLCGLVLEVVLARVLSPRGKGWLAFASSLVALGGVLLAMPGDEPLTVLVAAWDGPVSLAYHVDGLSVMFALMATGIGAAVLLYSIGYMASDPAATRFYSFMLVFIAGLVQLVYSADLLVLYLSWEVIGLCSFFLVGFWYRQQEAADGARKVLVMTHLAGYGLLAAILLLAAQTGTTLWTAPQVAAAFGTPVFVLMLVAALAKSVQFPLHTWIPDAMAAPTPVSALLHAACYVKAGVYLIARMHSLALWTIEWQALVIWIGTATMLVGVLYALVQSDVKRLLAFHTVSQIGYMVMGLGLGTPLGIAAGLLHCLNHAFFKGGLFLCAGAVQRATGTRDMDRMGGLALLMPETAILWLVSAGSIAGLPLLSGFCSKWLLYNAALEAGQVVPALVAWFVSILTVFSFLKATTGIFLGDAHAAPVHRPEIPRTMLAGTAVLGAGSVVLGIAPQLAVDYLINPLLPAVGAGGAVGVSWLGLSISGGSWFATGGLLLAAIAVAGGALVFYVAHPAGRMATALVTADGVFSGGEPLSGPARFPASDFSLTIKQGLAPFYEWVDADRYYRALGRGLTRLSQIVSRTSLWLEQRAIGSLVLLALLVAVAGLVGAPAPAARATVPTQQDWALVAGAGVAFLALFLASASTRHASRALPLMLVAGILALAGMGLAQPLLRVVTLEAASFCSLALVWYSSQNQTARRVYAVAVFVSAAAVVAGTGLLTGWQQAALPLLLAGFVIKLGLVPLYLWLPIVAEATPVTVIGLLVAVVDIATFGELWLLRQTAPWLFGPGTPWLAVAILSALGGAVLMLTQRDLRRLVAFSTIEDMGVLVTGLVLGGNLGLSGAAIGATTHALAKALVFASLASPQADKALTLDAHGMAARYPFAAAGFVVGALSVLGVPPTLGYLAHWRLYAAAADSSPWLLFALLVAAALALIAYTRVIASFWWGPGRAERGREPIGLVCAIAGLSVALLLLGVCPALWSGL